MVTNPQKFINSHLCPDKGYVLLFKGRGLISTLIRWQTRSCYSHAALLLPQTGRWGHNACPTIIESWQGAGVRLKPLKDWSDIDVYAAPFMTPNEWDRAFDFAADQLGKPYDYAGVFRFLTRENANDCNAWFCSSLVFASIRAGGQALLNNRPDREVSPAMLSWSPDLFRITP